MEKVSAVIIVYNEESNLRECLETVKWADEIVVVDSHSTDRTVEIACEFTDKIFQKEYEGHIDKKRFALTKASHDWVFSIDADERASDELIEEIRGALGRVADAVAGFDMPRMTKHLGRWIRHGEWYPDRVRRLFRRSRMRYEGTEPHDKVIFEGACGHLRGKLLHYNYRDFAHQIQTVQAYSDEAAKALFSKGRKAGFLNLFLRPWVKFAKCYILKRGFLDGWPGFIVAFTSAFYVLAKYAKLYELQNGRKR
ncbi:MAG: glycosyltransferase family 2 protein [Planctomycetota bacterium]|jgi:glycosyltransferase involved in cell wall biosynthesis